MRHFHVGDQDNGERFRRCEDLLKHTLFEGAGESGKTTAAKEAANFLFWRHQQLPMLILDGVGTLANGLYERLLEDIGKQEAKGRDMTSARGRLVFLKVQSEDTSGVSIDLLKLRMKEDDIGNWRQETCAERCDAVMAMLAHTTEGSEDFKLIHRYAKAALMCLIAAHRPVTELPLVLEFGHFEEGVAIKREIRKHRSGEKNLRLDQEIAVIDTLHATCGNRASEFDRLTGSTMRHFQWLWKDCAHLFSHDTLDYGAFHDRGGVFLIESSHPDPVIAANIRRVFYGIRNAHLTNRQPIDVADGPRYTPSLVIIDEQQGMNASLYVAGLANARNRNDIHWFLFQSSEQIGERGEHYNEIAAVMTTKVLFRPGSIQDAERSAYLIDKADPEGMVLKSISQSFGKSKGGSKTRSRSKTDSNGSRESLTQGGRSSEYAILHKEEGDQHTTKDMVREPSPSYGSDYSTAEQEGEAYGTTTGSDKKVVIQKVRIPVTEQVRILSRHLFNLQNGEAFYVQKGKVARVTHRHSLSTSNTMLSRQARIAQLQRLSSLREERPALFIIPIPKKEPVKKATVAAASKPGEAKKPARPKKQTVDGDPEETA